MDELGPAQQQKTIEVKNPHGLHMRVAKAVVMALSKLDAEVTIRNGDRSASGRSLLSLMTLDAPAGTQIEVIAAGPQAAAAIAVVEELVIGTE